MTNLAEKNIADRLLSHGGRNPLFMRHPVPSLLFGCDGVVREANESALALMRCDATLIEAMPMLGFFPEVRFTEIGDDLVANPAAADLRQVAVRRPDGSNFIARVQIVAPGEGPDAPLLATIEDTTAYEEELSAANKEFETFTSAASHDLRGPLRILKGFVEALDDECGAVLNEEGKSFLQEIVKASDRMEGLIDALLSLSRATRVEMACEKLDLSTLVELVTYDLRHGKGGREVECRIEPDVSGWGDVRLVTTALRILLGNAWKYTSRTETGLIRFHTDTRDGRTWFCVTDNGAGFDMTHASRLFQPFIRLHRQDEFPGYGIGLATVQRIVKRHGGCIEAESAVNEGTTIRFWLKPTPHDR